MTDPIGTAQERELIERLRRESLAVFPERLRDGHAYHATAFALDKAAAALQSRIAEVGRLTERVRELEAERTGCWVVTCSLCGCTNAHMDTCPNRAALSLQRRV